MVKEIKFLLYITVITLFFFFTIKYYLSDQFKKKVYRTHNNYELTINEYSNNLKILNSDTDNIIEYVDNKNNKLKKKYQFWKLLEND
ncbi:hypothetical protein IDH30_03420 [Pelagibacterales bacterium SAG-MED15]|jgi:hypothetical protein|nr:hypothetical protein [Candidatus Pelagibacter sp.]MBD1161318.1 hypothetical protein [Pelagibacterales bacterium SAG-MED15]RZO50695.1 MAG: hypothetical protein EVA74_02010 [Pelagibacterales bacterium]|tara:strand:- start:1637 stop:1897 length:261 start_codon:yes stop_codon:yes gene_type:complete